MEEDQLPSGYWPAVLTLLEGPTTRSAIAKLWDEDWRSEFSLPSLDSPKSEDADTDKPGRWARMYDIIQGDKPANLKHEGVGRTIMQSSELTDHLVSDPGLMPYGGDTNEAVSGFHRFSNPIGPDMDTWAEIGEPFRSAMTLLADPAFCDIFDPILLHDLFYGERKRADKVGRRFLEDILDFLLSPESALHRVDAVRTGRRDDGYPVEPDQEPHEYRLTERFQREVAAHMSGLLRKYQEQDRDEQLNPFLLELLLKEVAEYAMQDTPPDLLVAAQESRLEALNREENYRKFHRFVRQQLNQSDG